MTVKRLMNFLSKLPDNVEVKIESPLDQSDSSAILALKEVGQRLEKDRDEEGEIEVLVIVLRS